MNWCKPTATVKQHPKTPLYEIDHSRFQHPNRRPRRFLKSSPSCLPSCLNF
ncbi:hypothetical protein Hanom_Chr07g00580011 [Helianthus anomalus]